MSFTGTADDFFMDYTLQAGKTGQFGLLFNLRPGDTIYGVDLGEGFPVMLVK